MTDTTAAPPVEDAPSAELAILPGQSAWTPQQLAVLRQIGLEAAEQADVDLFFHVCRMSGLDPFRREIYMIGRKTKVNVREISPDTGNERTVERYVEKFTIQTGINGFRKRAREIAEQKGIKLGFEGPLWCGEDGVWRDVWPEKAIPVAAKFVVFRDSEAISFVAHYDEFVQMSGQPPSPNSMWSKMPRNQTGKCAEAGAIQRAFPDELGGLLFEDAAQPEIIDSDGMPAAPAEKRRPEGAGVAGVRAARERREAQRQQTAIAAEPMPDPDETPAQADLRKSMRDKLNGAIFATFGELKLNGDEKRRDRLVVIRAIVGREIESTKELTDAELQKLRNGLIDRKRDGTLDRDVTDWINGDELRREGINPDAEAKD